MKVINFYLMEDSNLHVPENWDVYETGPLTAKSHETRNKFDYVMMEGGGDWEPGFKFLCVYVQDKYAYLNETYRIWIEVKYPKEMNTESDQEEDKSEMTDFGEMIANTWLKKAKEKRREGLLAKQEHRKDPDNKSYPKFQGEWKESFIMALDAPAMKPHIKMFGIDSTEWKDETQKEFKNIDPE